MADSFPTTPPRPQRGPTPATHALGFTLKHDKIAEIEMISDPERLRHVDLAALDG
jgi:hypothetical protein